MIKQSFNDGWTFAKGIQGPFPSASEVQEITLPHDAMAAERRDPTCKNQNNTGFFPGGDYTYKKVVSVKPAVPSSSSPLMR